MTEEKESEFLKFVRKYEKALGFISGVIGFTLSILGFIQAWRANPNLFIWIISITGIVFLFATLFWTAFSWRTVNSTIKDGLTYKEPRFSRLWRKFAQTVLLICFILTIGIGHKLYDRRKSFDEKLIILLTQIHELNSQDNQTYAISEILDDQLNKEFLDDDSVDIIYLNTVKILQSQGKEDALRIGKKYNADIVFWGWYEATNTNAWFSLHVENISSVKYPDDEYNLSFSSVPLSDLDSFKLQQKIGEDFSSLIHFINGYIHAEAGNSSPALEELREIPELSNFFITTDKLLIYQGIIYKNLGETPQALENLNKVIEINSNYEDAYSNQGDMFAEIGELERVLENYNETILINPNSTDAHISRGYIYARLGDYEKALADFDRALSLNPNYEETYIIRAFTFARTGDYEKAFADYDRAISLNPNSVETYVNRGNDYARLGDYKKAIADYDKAISLNPNYAKAYLNRGNAYVDLRELEQALFDFSIAIEIDPVYAKAYLDRGNAYADLRELELALLDFSIAIEIDPYNTFAYLNRGIAYYSMGKYEQAIIEFIYAKENCDDNLSLCLSIQDVLDTLSYAE